jgi:hypothetical protein
MRRVNKFVRLPPADRRLLIQAAWLLSVVRLGLWLLPFERLRRFLARSTAVTCQVSTEKITWAMSVVGRYIPLATCLAQALATQVLLVRCGRPASLRIGVARGGGRRLQAHAWVESEGRIVLGDLEDLAHYTPLPPLEGAEP